MLTINYKTVPTCFVAMNWFEVCTSVVISRPWSRSSFCPGLGLETVRDLKAQVSVSRPGLKTACFVPTPVARLP